MMVHIKLIQKIFVLALCFFGLHFFAEAQNRQSDIKFKLAQSYERAGDFETAVTLYEEAFSKDSSSPVIYDALRRNYQQLKRYDEAVALMRRWLRKNPNDPGLISQLGSIYILKSDEQKAFEMWDRAIALNPKSEMNYRIVGSAMLQSRLFDRTIDLYKRGRTACNNQTLFTSDIAYLYGIMLNYADATHEYLNLIRQNPAQLGIAQANIASYTSRADGLSASITVVEEAVKSDEANIPFQQLLAWLYMEGKYFDRAHNVYKIIDEKTNAGGRELFNFAERTLREKVYPVAVRTYQEIMNSYPKFELMVQVKFGYARSLEESDDMGDTLKLFGGLTPISKKDAAESKQRYAGAIEIFNQVIAEYPNTEFAARSLLDVALIKRDKFFALDDARSSLEILVTKYNRFPAISLEGIFNLGDVYLASGNLDLAGAQYKSLSEISLKVNPLREKAALRLAELDYFNYKFQDAVAKLTDLTLNPNSDVANNALSLKLFIQENLQSSEEALKEYARADLLKRQYKYTEALQYFETIVKKYPKANIVDEALIDIGDLLARMGKYAEAVSSYNRLITDFPESILLDRTLMKTGRVYQIGLNDETKAIESYEQLLEKFPTSLFANEARRRIREMRGDSI
mgnify:CR=1 FL=1